MVITKIIYYKEGTPAYITKRFDVKSDGSKYQQEDFAQLSNRTKETHDLLSSIIHTPMESDTALGLYKDDIDSPFYSTYGYYGRENFLELATRLGILPQRAERVLNAPREKEQAIYAMTDRAFLSEEVKILYKKNVTDKIKRIQ